MSLQMVDRNQGQASRQSDSLAKAQPDHDATDQTGPCGGGHAIKRLMADAGLAHGPARHARDHLDMAASRDLGHDPAIGRMVVDLGMDHAGQDGRLTVGRQPHDRGRRLVAAGLQTEHGQKRRLAALRYLAAIVPDDIHRGRGSDPVLQKQTRGPNDGTP